MNDKNFLLLSGLYVEYNDILKPLVALVETEYEKFPTPIFNEIRSFNDHIARCFREKVNEKIITEQLYKARNHQKRSIFDCFKFMIVEYNKKLKKFEKQTKRINLTIIDNGRFFQRYSTLKQEAIDSTREAKRKETVEKFNDAFKLYEVAFIKYSELTDFISESNTKIIWAKCKTLSKSILKVFIIIVYTFLIGVAANLCSNDIKNIVKCIF